MKFPKLNTSGLPTFSRKTFKCSKLIVRSLILAAFLQFLVIQIIIKGLNSAGNTQSQDTTLFQFQSFLELMQSFPWEQYKHSVSTSDIPAIQKYSELLLSSILIPFTIKEPITPINSSCEAPPIWDHDSIGPCVRLKVPRKVGVILNFGFDVEALELHLHELDSVVDKFFLMEGIKIHNRYLDTKPSIWDMIKYTPRFSQFRNKIVHFVLDDADYAIKENVSTKQPELWARENLQKKVRLEKFLKWNSATGYFGPQDLLGIGDTDEIPSRHNINFLKSCQHGIETVKIGIWFPFPYIDTIFKSYDPVSPKYPYAYTNSIYSTVTAFTNSLNHVPDEDSVKQFNVNIEDAAVLGGIHFSKYPYLPFQLIKLLTCTTCGLEGLNRLINIGFSYKFKNNGDTEKLEHFAIKAWLAKWDFLSDRIKNVTWFKMKYGDDEADTIIQIPWFYQCNPERFPSFHRKRDQRIT